MNDWIVANINNPDFEVSDFINIADMSIDNTQLLAKDLYLKSDFIKENPLFKDQDGKFSEDKFNNYYNNKLKDFQEFYNSKPYDILELDAFDTDITADSKVRDTNLYLGRGVNPDRLKIGIEGINTWSAPERTKSEIAQMNKIWDTKNKEFKDYSPDDKSLAKDFLGFVKNIFSDPLVLAQYEENGEHIDPITGQLVKHKKGDYKLNNKGTYYYETLNGRSSIGKQVLSISDNLTAEGTGINKYDFFDSDDMKKRIPGVIAKNAVRLIPLFLGGPVVSSVYSTALIAREMSKALPMLYSIATMFGGSNETPLWLNTIAALGEKFTGGTSQHAKEHVFSFENFGNLISDVALQWGQQKTIAGAINKLRGATKYTDDAVEQAHALYNVKKKTMGALASLKDEDWMNSPLGLVCLKKFMPEAKKAVELATALGRNASLAYMAIVSNSDVYASMLQYGATRTEAAAVALGSTLGMFGLNKYTGLGELFFDDATDDAVKAARYAIKKEIKEAAEAFTTIKNSNATPANKLLGFINTAANKSKKVMSSFSEDLQYHTTNFLGKSIGEGLEEVSEELISDTAKAIYELAGKLGLDTSVSNVGAWDNALERYSMSLFGGMIGGGVFYGREALSGHFLKKDYEDLATLIRNGHVGDVRDVLDRMKNKGKLGSTKLSASEYELDKDGNPIWLTTSDKTKSQNNAIADLINDKITAIETVINNNQVNLSDEDLFKLMVLSESRYFKYQDISGMTNYYQDFSNILNELIAAELDYKIASKTIDGTVDGAQIPDSGLNNLTPEQIQGRNENLNNLKLKLENVRNKKNQFLSGDNSLDYTRKLNFAMDPVLHNNFLVIDEDLLWKQLYGDKSKTENLEEYINFVSTTLAEHKKNVLKENLSKAWERYKQIENTLIPELTDLANNTPQFKDWNDKFQKLIESDLFDINKLKDLYLNFDSRLEGEDDAAYENRSNKIKLTDLDGEIQEESDEDFKHRYNQRVRKINELNYQIDLKWVDSILSKINEIGGELDQISARTIMKLLPTRAKDRITYKIQLSNLSLQKLEILQKLNPDLSNIDEILEMLNNLEEHKLPITQFIQNTSDNMYAWLLDHEEDYDITIGDIIENVEDLFADWDEETKNDFLGQLNNLIQILGNKGVTNITDITLGDLYRVEDLDVLNDIYNLLKSFDNNEVQSLLQDLKNNPIVKLKQGIKDYVKNPIIELIKSLAGKTLDSKEVEKIEELLETIDNEYQNITDINTLEFDEQQLKTLTNAKDVVSLIKTFIYAASSTAEYNRPIGHNKVMNEFARNHKDIVRNWEELPEIDLDYAATYLQQLQKYENELDSWIQFSYNNSINKRSLFVRTDKAFAKSLYDLILNKLNLKAFRVNVDDKEYNLLEGVVSDSDTNVSLFNHEKTLYYNFQKALKDSGLTVELFLEKSGLLNKLIKFDKLKDLKIARLTPDLKFEHFSDYDILLYFANIFTFNPVDFYTQIKGKVNTNLQIAPIASQEYGARIASASINAQFKEIIKFAHKKSGDRKYGAYNTTIAFGDAGAGKSQVVAKYAKELLADDVEILTLGPTDRQAKTLLGILKTSEYSTITKFLKEILGEDLYTAINEEIKNKKLNTKNVTISDSKYLDVFGENEFAKYTLKDGANITFNKLDKIPKLLVIDEATHIPSIFALILDMYMGEVGGHLLFLGDSKQRGYLNNNNGMGNIRDIDIFAIRTPELTVSLRDNNTQKQSNLETVKSLLNQVLENAEKLPYDEYIQYLNTVSTLLPKLKFKVYNKEEITGDMITGSITPEIISKIKKEGATVGFIGSKDSVAYQTLKTNGVILDDDVMSLDSMLGLEFDYVVIDLNFTKPELKNILGLLLNLYTLMSRGRSASIFIDNGLSSIIGDNILQEYTAKAPSLTDKINGVSAVDELREFKLNLLNKFDLTPLDLEPSKQQQQQKNPFEYFADPDKSLDNDNVIEFIKNLEQQDEEELLSSIIEFVDDNISEFDINAYSSVTYTGVSTELNHKAVDKDGKEHVIDAWKIQKPAEGPLRNLQALLGNNQVAHWYTDKQRWLDLLYKTKSMLLFDHSFDETRVGSTLRIIPQEISNNFNKLDWDNGTYEIEIRDASGEIRPLHSAFKLNGLTFEGNNYSVNIVFKVKNKQGRECIFDIAGMNDPNTLYSKLEEIKSNLTKRINDSKTDDKTKEKLKNILNTINAQADKYESMFKSWINQYNKDGLFSLNVSNIIRKNKTTWFKKRVGKNIRLGGRVNPNTLEKDDLNLKALNPGMVFSDVYTFANENNDFNEVDVSVLGKAVVFYSSDKLLQPEDLPNIYMNQKKDPKNNYPIVRMLVLDNYGLSMSLITDSDFKVNFSNGDEDRLPLAQNYTGILMFTSMWNFRAALEQFKEALKSWQSLNDYTSDFVNKLIKALHHIYVNKLSGDLLNTYLLGLGISQEDLNNLTNFNLEICKNIPTFRLGYSEKNGFHILQFDVSESNAYKETTANLLVINPDKADQFHKFIDDILGQIVSDNIDSLQLKLLKEDGSTWDTNEVIDLSLASHKRSLSNLLDLKNDILSITYDGKHIAYPKGLNWSYIPKFISSILRTTTYYQYNPDDLSSNGLNFAKILVYSGTDKDGKKLFNVLKSQIGQWLTPDSLGKILLGTVNEPGILKSTATNKRDEKYRRKENYVEHPDRSLVDMFDLIFHGTVDDIHKFDPKVEYNENGEIKTIPGEKKLLIQLTDARFKQGFFIHPGLDRRQGNKVEKIQSPNNKDKAIFYKLEQQEEFYTCDVDLRPSGVSINLNELFDLYTSGEKPKEKPKEIIKEKSDIIETEKYKEVLLSFTGISTGNPLQGTLMEVGGGRIAVVIDINGMYVPFYCSTGHGGKKNVLSGKWYPFFGMHEDGWLNKLSEDDINNYYGIPLLKEISELLDKKYGDVTKVAPEETINPVFTKEYAENKFAGTVLALLNRDITPVDNGLGAYDAVLANVEKVHKHIQNSFGKTFEDVYPNAASIYNDDRELQNEVILTDDFVKNILLMQEILNKDLSSFINDIKTEEDLQEKLLVNCYYGLDSNGDLDVFTLFNYLERLLGDPITKVEFINGKITINDSYEYNSGKLVKIQKVVEKSNDDLLITETKNFRNVVLDIINDLDENQQFILNLYNLINSTEETDYDSLDQDDVDSCINILQNFVKNVLDPILDSTKSYEDKRKIYENTFKNTDNEYENIIQAFTEYNKDLMDKYMNLC